MSERWRRRGVEPLAVGTAVRGGELERRLRHYLGHAGALAPLVELAPRQLRQPRNGRIDAEARFLLDDRDDRADVLRGRLDAQRAHCRVHVFGPAATLGEARGQELLDQRRAPHDCAALSSLLLRAGQRAARRRRAPCQKDQYRRSQAYRFAHPASLANRRR